MARHPQEPHQPGGGPAPVVVVRDDCRPVANAERAHGAGKVVRAGQRVAPCARRRRPRQASVEVDENSPRQVLLQVSVVTRASVEVPAHIGDHHLRVVLRQPGRGDHRGQDDRRLGRGHGAGRGHYRDRLGRSTISTTSALNGEQRPAR